MQLNVNNLKKKKCIIINLTRTRICVIRDFGTQSRGRTCASSEFKGLKPDAKPKFLAARQVPYSLKQKVNEEIDRLLQRGVITPVSFSKYASPVVVRLKKDKTVRLCGDFKTTVNPNLDIECYPLPKIDSIFATLSGGEKFTKIDLKDAYNQFELDEESKDVVVINTQKGLFKYNRLPFGISSAPALFQRVIDTLIKGIPMVEGFQDDIIVTGKNDSEHLKSLEIVLSRLKEAGLRVKKEKCEFMLSHITYLGYRIDKLGLHPLQERLKAIKEAPVPLSVEQLKAFIGTMTYYGKFIKNQSTLFAPLYKLLVKGVPWKWETEQMEAFEAAKEAICGTAVLVHYDPKKELILACDASPYGVGAVLSHPGKQQGDPDRPIAFASRTLTNAEKNYSQLEKEALALVYGVTKYRDYLVGQMFTLQTDHQPLVSLLSEKKQIPRVSAARIQRWALLLAGYSYRLTYRKGKLHANADALSRLPLQNKEENTPNLEELILLLSTDETHGIPCDVEMIKSETYSDKTLHKVYEFVSTGWPKDIEKYKNLDEMDNFYKKKLELSMEGGVLLWGLRIVVPKTLRKLVLKELHDTHQGMSLMKALAREKVWWPGVDADIERYVTCCNTCQQTADNQPKNVYIPWPSSEKPWEKIHADYLGPIEGKMILIIVDSFSKWLEAIIVNSATTHATITEFRKLFARFGLPYTVVTDNGTHFSGFEVDKYLKSNGVKHIYIAPYHPESNGQAERAVRIVKKGLNKLKFDLKKGLDKESGPLQVRLDRVLINYRRTPVTTTGISPAEAFLNRKIRTRMDLLRPKDVRETRELETKSYQTGEKVWTRNYGMGEKWMPGKIIETKGNTMVAVETEKGVSKRHFDQIRKDTRFKKEDKSKVETTKVEEENTPLLEEDTGSELVCEGTSKTSDMNYKPVEKLKRSTREETSKTSDMNCKPVEKLRRSTRGKKPVVKLNL